MPAAETDKEVLSPTAASESEIRKELEAVVASPRFAGSKRYPTLLRFVVEKVLAGEVDDLKERTLGIEVFGRIPSYDTNADPIVRVTAAEVRKRLAQHYEIAENRHFLQIAIQVGSYVPQFIRLASAPVEQPAEAPPKLHPSATPLRPESVRTDSPASSPREQGARWRPYRWWLLSFICALLVVALLVVSLRGHAPVDARVRFWAPFVGGVKESALVCVGPLPLERSAAGQGEPPPQTQLLDALQRYNTLPLSDAITLSRITGLLGSKDLDFRILNADVTNFEDLQHAPTILIGGLTNPWTVRLTSRLPFGFQDNETISSIVDRSSRHHAPWELSRDIAYSQLTQDFAIIARYQDVTTGKVTVIAAGIGPNGTLAAGEFLTRGDALAKLLDSAPPNWKNTGVEAVIGTEVINGKSGPPHVVAAEFW